MKAREMKAESSKGPERKLGTDDLEVLAKTLQSLVKHRGGGPFGKGRLEGYEADELESFLLKAVNILKSDATVAGSAAAAPAPSPAITPAPVPAPAPAPTPAPFGATNSATSAQNSLAVQTPLLSQETTPVRKEVPIAMGLNNFLENPSVTSTEEMGALRDGLIQVLGMLTQEIAQRPATQLPPGIVSAPANTMSSQRGSKDEASMEAAKRITSINSSGGRTDNDLESELRVGLGLLLKHRGGPGFGHGRLEGVELDSLENRLRSITKKLREEVLA